MSHPFVKMDPVTKEFVESCVYNQKTGEKILCWPVDAREIIAQSMAAKDGLYAATPPKDIPEPEPAMAEEVAAPVIAAPVDKPAGKGKGR